MSSDHRDGSTISLLLVPMKHELLAFKVFGGGLHKLSHFNSRIITLVFLSNCCRLMEAKNFSRNIGQFKWVARKASISELLIRNIRSQLAELVQRPATMLYFTGDHEFFQKSPEIKCFYDRGRKHFYSLARKT